MVSEEKSIKRLKKAGVLKGMTKEKAMKGYEQGETIVAEISGKLVPFEVWLALFDKEKK